MMRRLFIAVMLSASVSAQPVPEECIVVDRASGTASVTHGGTTYRLANDGCREQFLTDPERYAQLYDTLLELQAAGAPAQAPARASLVPS